MGKIIGKPDKISYSIFPYSALCKPFLLDASRATGMTSMLGRTIITNMTFKKNCSWITKFLLTVFLTETVKNLKEAVLIFSVVIIAKGVASNKTSHMIADNRPYTGTLSVPATSLAWDKNYSIILPVSVTFFDIGLFLLVVA